MRHFFRSVNRSIPLWIFLLTQTQFIYSQDNFFLEKPPFKRTLIKPGDSVRVLISGMDKMVGLKYQGSRDSTLFLSGDSLQLQQIEKIWIRRPRNARYWLGMIAYGGLTSAILFPPLMVIDAIGRGGFQDYDVKRIGYSVGGGLSLMAIAHRLRWKRFKLDGKYQLVIRKPIQDTVVPSSNSGQGPE